MNVDPATRPTTAAAMYAAGGLSAMMCHVRSSAAGSVQWCANQYASE